MQNPRIFLGKDLIEPTQTAYDNYLSQPHSQEYLKGDLCLETPDGRVERPNQGLVHSLLVAINIILLIDFYKKHAASAYQPFLNQYTSQHLHILQIAAIFSVIDQKEKAFANYCNDHQQELELTDEEIEYYKILIINKDDPVKINNATEIMHQGIERLHNEDNYHLLLLANTININEFSFTQKNYPKNTIFIHGPGSTKKLYVKEEDVLIEKGVIELDIFWQQALSCYDSFGNLLLSQQAISKLPELQHQLKTSLTIKMALSVAYLPKQNPMDFYLLSKAHNGNLFCSHDQHSMQETIEQFKVLCGSYDSNIPRAFNEQSFQKDFNELATTFSQLIEHCGGQLYCSFDEQGISSRSKHYDKKVFGFLSHNPKKAIDHINASANAIQAKLKQKATLKDMLEQLKKHKNFIKEQINYLSNLLKEYESLNTLLEINKKHSFFAITSITEQIDQTKKKIQGLIKNLEQSSFSLKFLKKEINIVLQTEDAQSIQITFDNIVKKFDLYITKELNDKNNNECIQQTLKNHQEILNLLNSKMITRQKLMDDVEKCSLALQTVRVEISNAYNQPTANKNEIEKLNAQENIVESNYNKLISSITNCKKPNFFYKFLLGLGTATATASFLFGIALLTLLLTGPHLSFLNWMEVITIKGSIGFIAGGGATIFFTAIGLRILDIYDLSMQNLLTNLNAQKIESLDNLSKQIKLNKTALKPLTDLQSNFLKQKNSRKAALEQKIDYNKAKITEIEVFLSQDVNTIYSKEIYLDKITDNASAKDVNTDNKNLIGSVPYKILKSSSGVYENDLANLSDEESEDNDIVYPEDLVNFHLPVEVLGSGTQHYNY